MTDFRDSAYNRYGSAFKGTHNSPEASGMTAWYAVKYYPLFHHLDHNAPVLDLGCGQGHFLHFLRQAGFNAAEGVDISAEQIAVAVAHGFNARVADAFEFLAAQPGRYQMIAALDFVEHFSKAELMRLLLWRLTKLLANAVRIIETGKPNELWSENMICLCRRQTDKESA